MLRTNSAVYRTRVRDYLLHDDRLPDGWPTRTDNDNTLDREASALIRDYRKFADSPAREAHRALHLATLFDSEVNKHQRDVMPILRDRVEHWLAGMRLNVDHTYPGIAATARHLHAPHTLTDSQLDRIQDQWFRHLATQLLRIWHDYGIEVPA